MLLADTGSGMLGDGAEEHRVGTSSLRTDAPFGAGNTGAPHFGGPVVRLGLAGWLLAEAKRGMA